MLPLKAISGMPSGEAEPTKQTLPSARAPLTASAISLRSIIGTPPRWPAPRGAAPGTGYRKVPAIHRPPARRDTRRPLFLPVDVARPCGREQHGAAGAFVELGRADG